MSTPTRFALEKVLALRETFGSSSSLSPRFPLHVPLEELAASEYSAQMSIVSFAHHDYLALDAQPRVRAAIAEALDIHGLSAGAPRRLGGESTICGELEAALAAFVGVDAVVTLPSAAPVAGDIAAHLLKDGGSVFIESQASLLVKAAAAASGATIVTVDGDAPERVANAINAMPGRAPCLFLAEGVKGDGTVVADLAAVVARAKAAGGWVAVDETRTFGILGSLGRGAIEALEIDGGDVDLVFGSLGEALVSAGAFVGGSTYVVEALKRTWLPLERGTGLSPALAAAAHAALSALRGQPSRLQRLRRNIVLACDAAMERGLQVLSCDQMPTLAIRCESDQQAHLAALAALENGFYVPPESGSQYGPSLLMTVTAGHRRGHIEGALDSLRSVLMPQAPAAFLRRSQRTIRRNRPLTN